MSSYSTVQSHRSMVFDDLRNALYFNAIRKSVNEMSVVLDLGAGLGLHGIMAATLGAQKVYLVEPTSVLEVAKQAAMANAPSSRVEALKGIIEEVDLPEKANVIISVFTGNFLLTEDLLPSLFYARDNYLAPGGHLIPDRARMIVVPVTAPDYYKEKIDCWSSKVHGVDFGLVRKYAANSLYYDGPYSRTADFLAEPEILLDLDFMTATEAACRNETIITIANEGLCHGLVGWFDARLGEEWLSTSPQLEQTHWRQVFFPIDRPIQVKKGETLSFELHRPEHGQWSWTIEHNEACFRQSTFLSSPLTPEMLSKRSNSYRPVLSTKGQAAGYVMKKMDGSLSSSELASEIISVYPSLFSTPEQAEQFVKMIVDRYS